MRSTLRSVSAPTGPRTAETILSTLRSTLAAARLTRVVTTDWIGEWTVVRPIKAWAAGHENEARQRRDDWLEENANAWARRGRGYRVALAELGKIRASEIDDPERAGAYALADAALASRAEVAPGVSKLVTVSAGGNDLGGPVDPATIPEYNPNDPITWQAKLAKGFDCPFCVGFWIALGVVAVEAATLHPRLRPIRPAWKVLTGALATNYVAAHVGSRVDA